MPKQEKVKINVKERVEDNTIDLSLSELTEIPVKDIASFKRCTILDLSNNKIISLGKNFGILSHLTKLDLSKNQIKYLPEDFGSLKNLRHLDLYNNRLEHLPLSFGNLNSLRYLDLKSNPLTPALSKIVGQCLTTKDCNESAKNTVKFLAQMQVEVQKAKEKLQQEDDAKIEAIEDNKTENQKPKKTKKNKSKSKKSKRGDSSSPKANSEKNNKNQITNKASESNEVGTKSSTALRTLFVFFLLLAINIVMIYIMTVKNPEIAEKLVEFIPQQYREIILSKSEHLRLNFLRVSDWLQQFRTPPEQN